MQKEINKHLSVDCVVFGYDSKNLNVLLVKRTLTDESNGYVFYFSDYTLAGNHVYIDEKIDDAASRILFDLTGLENIYLEKFRTFDDPDRISKPLDKLWLKNIDRDPSFPVVSIGYFALLSTKDIKLKWKGREVKWVPVNDVGTLGFDHNYILREGLIALRNKMKQEPIGFKLLPTKFSITQLQRVYEKVYDMKFNTRNFHEKINSMNCIVPYNMEENIFKNKTVQLYVFNENEYKKESGKIMDVMD